jgi:glycosyltransferase involved in cell wall biosynthesis
MPSEHEGFPLAVAESFCAGTPVIASQAPGLGWVSGFRTGRSVPRTISAWVAELEMAAAHRHEAERLNARRLDAADAVRRFSAARGVAEWRTVYDLACRRPGQPAPAVAGSDPAPGKAWAR